MKSSLIIFNFFFFTAEFEMIANRKQTGFLDNLKNFWTPELLRPFLFIMLFFFFCNFASFLPAKPYLIFIFEEIGLPCTAQWTLVCNTWLFDIMHGIDGNWHNNNNDYNNNNDSTQGKPHLIFINFPLITKQFNKRTFILKRFVPK